LSIDPPATAERVRQEGNMDNRVKISQQSGFGMIWFIGWLFTIGYLKLGFWMGLLGIIVWPYFLGSHFAPALPM